MSSRIDATAQRVQGAVTMKQVTGSMAGVVKSMDAALRSMNLEKVSQMHAVRSLQGLAKNTRSVGEG